MKSSYPPTKVYAMCGLAFSGKSSTARRVVRELGTELVSLDAINHERGLCGGAGLSVAQWEETSFIAMERLRVLLRAGHSAVVDDTFSRRFLRDRCRAAAEASGARFLILYLDTALEVIVARRQENYRQPIRHHIHDDVFAAHIADFQHPDPDEESLVRLQSQDDLERWLVREKSKR